jgi:hypothetical protein
MKFSKKVKNYLMSLVITAVMTKLADAIVGKLTKEGSGKKKDKIG